MKVEIFIRSFGGPILLAILLVIGILYGQLPPFQIFMQTIFVLSFTLLKLLSDGKFVCEVAIKENKLLVSFYTPLLKIKTAEFEVSEIKDVKLTKRSFISVIWHPNLIVKSNNERKSFTILSKEMYNKIQLYLKSENIWAL